MGVRKLANVASFNEYRYRKFSQNIDLRLDTGHIEKKRDLTKLMIKSYLKLLSEQIN